MSKSEADFFDDVWSKPQNTQIKAVLNVPGVPSLRGLRVLICSCGSWTEAVSAANAGDEVWAFDISPVGVAKALEVAAFNHVSVKADVMDFHDLQYPDDSFDVIYGSSILHHVDCAVAGREVLRCLIPGGSAFFWENSDRNPLLRYARRVLFGKPGGFQRQKVLFLRRAGTTDEYPLTEEEVRTLSDIFLGNMERIYRQFIFSELLSIHAWRGRHFLMVMKYFDRMLVKFFPAIMHYSFEQGILLKKST